MKFIQCLLLVLMLPNNVLAITLQDLQKTGQVEVAYRVASEGEIVQFQPVSIEVEVSTDRWFAGGSRVGRFDIENAIVYRASELSTNLSRTVAGKTRAIQLWTIEFYPQQAGQLEIPDLDISVSVNAEGNTIVEGSVTLQGRSIEVIAPPVMADIPQWLAAQNLTITESYEGLQETYIPGDAITRVITMEVEGNPAMMLPEVEFPDTEGLAVYRSPAKVYETSDRGRLVGHREQRFIYTIEQPGRYQLPGYNYHWWNLAAGEKEVINLPALIIGTEGVAGVASEVSESGVAEVASDNIDMLLAYLLFAIVVLLMVLSLARSGLKQLWLVRQEKSRRNAVFIDAIKSQQPILALQALYHLLECQQQFKGLTTLDAVFAADNQCLQLLNRLKRQAYCSGEPKSLTVAEANMILRYLNQRSEKQWPWNEPVVLSLNH